MTREEIEAERLYRIQERLGIDIGCAVPSKQKQGEVDHLVAKKMVKVIKEYNGTRDSKIVGSDRGTTQGNQDSKV